MRQIKEDRLLMTIQLDTNSALYQTLHGNTKTAAVNGELSVADADSLQKVEQLQQPQADIIPEDEYISGESQGGGTGTYSVSSDENGNTKITVDAPLKAAAAAEVPKATIRQAKGSSITTEDTTSQKSESAQLLSSLQTAVTSESGASSSTMNSDTDSSQTTDTSDNELQTLERKKQQLEQQISAAGDDSDSVAELERSLAEIERQISNLEN